MGTSKLNIKTCANGHQFYKSSDCPTCPVCENKKKPASGFLSLLAAPARRALEREGIDSLQQLAKRSEVDLLHLHGIGQNAVAKLKQVLAEKGLSFAKK